MHSLFNGREPERMLVSESQLSNEELAIALLSPSLPYDPQRIRCGAAMAGAEDNDPGKLAKLAIMERCVSPLRYVAEAGARFEPYNDFWKQLLHELPPGIKIKPGVMPHPTRFVAMTGITREGVGIKTDGNALYIQTPMQGNAERIHGRESA